MKQVRKEIEQTYARAKRVVSNGEVFIQATALAILVGFSFYAARKLHLDPWFQWVLAISEAVVALRALSEYVKFLDK